jgi:hypothetical protein
MSGVLNDTITEVLLLNARKKSLEIPNGLLEVVNRRTDNTMAKGKRTKGQTTIYRALHRKLKIKQHEPH